MSISPQNVLPPLEPAIARGAAPETISGLLISLLFWLCLLLAAVMFGAVALSPKLLELERLRAQYQSNQLHLVQVENQNEQLQRIADAIRKDKEFAAELTRAEFDAVRRDEEIIPVEAELRLVPQELVVPPVPAVTPQASYRPIIVPFAENDSLRTRMLAGAAVLVLVSFTWLPPACATRGRPVRPTVVRRSIFQTLRSRYTRPA